MVKVAMLASESRAKVIEKNLGSNFTYLGCSNYFLKIKEMIERRNARIIILDLEYVCLGMINRFKELKNYYHDLKIIVIANNRNPLVASLCYKRGVSFYLYRDSDLKTLNYLLTKYHKSLMNKKGGLVVDERGIVKILNLLGMKANLKGYIYLKEALLVASVDSNYYLHTTSYLYPYLSKKYHASSQSIERAIRIAVENCWERGDIDSQEAIFGYSVSKDSGRPTNGQFIAQIVSYMHSLL